MQIPENAKAEEISRRFLELAGNIGGDVALYCICATLNLPVDTSQAVPTWEAYLEYLEGLSSQETFIDGETDVETVLADGASEQERWERDWGYGDPDNPYTVQDYKSLDGIFRMYSTRLDSAGGMDAQQEDTLRSCSRMALLRDKCIAKGDKDSAAIASTGTTTAISTCNQHDLHGLDSFPGIAFCKATHLHGRGGCIPLQQRRHILPHIGHGFAEILKPVQEIGRAHV